MAESEFGGLILTAKAAKDFIEEILVFQKNKKVAKNVNFFQFAISLK